MEKQIKLEESGLTAVMKTSISYGEHQKIQACLMAAAKGNINPSTQEFTPSFDPSGTIEWNFTKLTTLIVKFVDKEGKEFPATRQAISDLPMEDGKVLEAEADAILEGVKKK